MAPRSIAIFLFLGVVSVNCQTWNRLPAWNSGAQNNNWNVGNNNFQNNGNNIFGNGNTAFGGIWGNNNRPVERLTCIGKNNFKDEMRITVTLDQGNNMNNMWWMNNRQQRLNIESNIMIDPQSSTNGMYQYVITENGRVEDGCLNEYLGEILRGNSRPNPFFQQFLNNNRQNRRDGVVGDPFRLAPGNGQHWSGKINFRTLEDIVGRGCGLCRSSNIVNGRCLYVIPMCCKFGYDERSAMVPFNQNGMNQVGGMQTVNIGQIGMMNGGMNTGMGGGMNTGMGGGMNTGMGGGMNTGMGGGMNAGTNPAAGSNPMGLNFK